MKYNVILADPPWKYRTDMVTGHKSLDHYSSMSNNELKSMDVCNICDEQCVLFMWTTTPNLDIAIEVGRAWGFDYKQVAFVWDKQRTNPGNYTLTQCELVLVFRPKKGEITQEVQNECKAVFPRKIKGAQQKTGICARHDRPHVPRRKKTRIICQTVKTGLGRVG